RRSDDDFRSEIDTHLEEETERQMRQRGLDPRSARFAARKAFGNVLGAVERFHESRRIAWMERVSQHVRYAFRALVQRPAFSLTAIASLGIGIGFMTAIFTIFYALSFRALPVRDADGLVNVYQQLHGRFDRGVHGVGSMVSYPEFQSYMAAIDSARAHGGGAVVNATVYSQQEFAAETRAGKVYGEYVACNYFSVLHVRIARGRGFTPDECAHVGDPSVVVLSHAMWAREYGSDSSIVGRVVRVNQVPMTVVGVAEPGFGGLTFVSSSVWIPVTLEPTMDHGADSIATRDWSWMIMAARLAPGAGIKEAEAQLQLTATQRDEHLFPGRQTQVYVTKAALLNFPEARTQGALIASLVVLLGVVLVVMVCANIMNLLLARGISRRREIGIRLAIGASRARLIEQLLTESTLIAFLGGAAGYALAYLLPGLVPRLIPIPDLQINLVPDARILVTTLVLAMLTAIVFGLVPALHATNLDLVSASKGAMQTRRGQVRTSRLRSAIVGVQIAGSALLLIVSTLFVRAARHAANVDPGYAVDNVVSFGLNLQQLGYSPSRTAATYEELRARIAASPGVDGVGLVWPLPMLGRRSESVQIPGKSQDVDNISMASASAGVFQAFALRFVDGRAYTDAEASASSDARPAVVSQAMAKLITPTGRAVGLQFQINHAPYVVVGVVADARYTSLGNEGEPFIFLPPMRSGRAEELRVLARTRGAPAQLERAVPQWVREMDPNIVVDAERLSSRMDLALKPVRIASMVAGAVGMLAMFLALVGIYGVVSYAVSLQTREIAIRQALGATRRTVLRLVMRQGSRPIVIGLVTATVLALGLSRVIRNLLFGVSPIDPLSYGAVIGLLLLAAAIAMVGPARRATRISPAAVLRED
ncbi:MAG TPA: ABC transporter permease, partial [Gemmatimonadaceae bacterium]|nr:ABC transporter permease [Gemmatimonadaceae bacterium]